MQNSAQDICRFHYSQIPSIMCNVRCGGSVGRDGQLELNSCGYTIS